MSSQSLEAAQQDIDLLKQQLDFYKAELDKSMLTIEDLMNQIKEANIALVRTRTSAHVYEYLFCTRMCVIYCAVCVHVCVCAMPSELLFCNPIFSTSLVCVHDP